MDQCIYLMRLEQLEQLVRWVLVVLCMEQMECYIRKSCRHLGSRVDLGLLVGTRLVLGQVEVELLALGKWSRC